MNIFQRLGNGWHLAMQSFSVIAHNKKLIAFPLISTIILGIVLASFAGGIFTALGGELAKVENLSDTQRYLLLFLFYLISYEIILFFNTALIHCSFMVFNGEEPTLKAGLAFSCKKLWTIFIWGVISAIVGVILRIIEDKNEKVAAIIAGILGMLWSVLTFFVLPVMVYENQGVFSAIKRSSALLKDTWGERVGANFAFGLIGILIFVVIGIPVALLFGSLNILAAAVVVGAVALLVSAVTSAAETVFKAAAYQYAIGNPIEEIPADTLRGSFT